MNVQVHRTRNSMCVGVTQNSDMFMRLFQEQLRPYIENIRNVLGDGNCGFRVIANALGYGADEWVRVRDELLEELHNHTEHYMTIYHGTQEYQDYEKCLQWCDESQPAPQAHWLDMPNMGHLIACRYNCVVYFISNAMSVTCLPLRTHPEPMDARKEIALGFVNENHFVEVCKLNYTLVFRFF